MPSAPKAARRSRGALGAVLADAALDDLMRGELMLLPEPDLSCRAVAGRPIRRDPCRARGAQGLARQRSSEARIARRCMRALRRCPTASRPPRAVRARSRRRRWPISPPRRPRRRRELAAAQYRAADNMTDRQGALMVAGRPRHAACDKNCWPISTQRYAGNALVIDKWFSLQAQSLHPDALAHVKALAEHPDFTMKNPNRVRALYMGFAANPHAFHAADGEGYRMIADLIIALDPLNPQTAARFVPQLGRWRRIEPGRAALMRGELERIAADAAALGATPMSRSPRALADAVEVIRAAALAGVPHGFLRRKGGVSTGMVAGLDVGFGADDDPRRRCAENRRASRVDAVMPGASLASVYQVHSADCGRGDRTVGVCRAGPSADALVTDRPGLLLGIVTADCAPVLFADARRPGVVGAAHAGWRGAHGGVIEATRRGDGSLGRAPRHGSSAAIGPAIAQASYEVDGGFPRRVYRGGRALLRRRAGPATTSSTSRAMPRSGSPTQASGGSNGSGSTPIRMPIALLLLSPRDPSRRGRLRTAILADRIGRARPGCQKPWEMRQNACWHCAIARLSARPSRHRQRAQRPASSACGEGLPGRATIVGFRWRPCPRSCRQSRQS